jgi:hypothetical protein
MMPVATIQIMTPGKAPTPNPKKRRNWTSYLYTHDLLDGLKASRTLVGHGAAEPDGDKHHKGIAPANSDVRP